MRTLAAKWAAECPIERATTYYFANSGDDSNAGTEAAPFETITKAIAMAGPDVALKFKRGDVWRYVSTSLDPLGGSISSYGSTLDPRPRLTGQTLTIPSGGASWTNATGDRWTATQAGAYRIFNEDDFFAVVRKAASTAEVEANSPSYYIDGSTIHLNAGSGIDPNTINWACTPINQATNTGGIEVTLHGSRVDGLLVDSHGLDGGALDQSWAIRCDAKDDEVQWVSNCGAYYSPRHPIGSLLAVGSGGRTLYTNNDYGGVEEIAGASLAVNYAFAGGQEALWIGNECRIGSLPMTVGQSGTNGLSVFAHTDGDEDAGMLVVLDHYVSQQHGYGCTSIGNANDMPGNVDDLSTLRCVINGRLDVAAGTKERLWCTGVVHLDCDVKSRPADQSQGFIADDIGWMIGCRVEYDFSDVAQTWGQYNGVAPTLNTKTINSWIHAKNNPASTIILGDRDSVFGGTSPSTAWNVNNIFTVVDTGGSIYLGLPNVDAANCQRNAVIGFTELLTHEATATDHVRDKITLASVPSIDGPLPIELLGRGVAIDGITPEVADGQINVGPSPVLDVGGFASLEADLNALAVQALLASDFASVETAVGNVPTADENASATREELATELAKIATIETNTARGIQIL